MQPTDPSPSPSTGERRTEMTMTQTDLTARIDATVEMLLNREAQHVTALFPDQSCALRALLVEARAQIAAQAEALARVAARETELRERTGKLISVARPRLYPNTGKVEVNFSDFAMFRVRWWDFTGFVFPDAEEGVDAALGAQS